MISLRNFAFGANTPWVAFSLAEDSASCRRKSAIICACSAIDVFTMGRGTFAFGLRTFLGRGCHKNKRTKTEMLVAGENRSLTR